MKDRSIAIIYIICFLLACVGFHYYFTAEEPDQLQNACWFSGTALVVGLTTFIANKISNKKHGNSL